MEHEIPKLDGLQPPIDGFFKLAWTLLQIVRRFEEASEPSGALAILETREKLLEQIEELHRSGAVSSQWVRTAQELLVEIYERDSLRQDSPTEDAIRTLLSSLYSLFYSLINDPTLFETELRFGPPNAVRNAVAGLFRPILQPVRSRGFERVRSLADGRALAERRLNASTRLVVDDSSGSGQIVSEPMLEWALDAPDRRRVSVPKDADGDDVGVYSSPPTETRKTADRVYKVWYGTNRAPKQPADEALGYGGVQDVRLHFGYCHVFVPRNHQIGSLGTSWLRRIVTFQENDTVELRNRFPLGREEFQRKMQAELTQWAGMRTGLVYVHGFRVTFDNAARLAAQVGCDLEVNGITSFYSWPAAGTLHRYVRDRETADLKLFAPHFVEFLDTLLSVTELHRVDIVAHSMGNRVLAEAIDEVRKLTVRQREK